MTPNPLELANEVNDLLQQQRTTLASLNQLELEKERLEKNIEDLNQKVGDKAAELNALLVDLDSATTSRAGTLAQLEKINHDLSQAQALLDSTKTENDKVIIEGRNTLADIQSKQNAIVSDAKTRLDTLQSQKETLEREIAPIADQISRLTDKVNSYNNQIVSLKTQTDDAVAELNLIKTKQSVINDSVTALEKRQQYLIDDIAAKEVISNGIDGDISTKNTKIVELDKQVKDVEELLKTNNDRNTDFLKARAGLDSAREQVEERLVYLKSKYGELGEPW